MSYTDGHVKRRYARQHAALLGLGGSAMADVPTLSPSPGRPQPPIYPLVKGPAGGYLEVRNSPSDGSCGVGTYPCRHPGLDVWSGRIGTPVVAPENGVVVAIFDGNSSPFGGYGPWGIVIQGDSGKFHLLGHLDPSTQDQSSMGQHVTAGDQVGTVSSALHTHWEVRSKLIPDWQHGEDGFSIIEDPTIWLTLAPVGGPLGAILVVGSAATLLYLVWRRRRG